MTLPVHVTARGIIIDQGFLLLAYDPRYPDSYYYTPGGHIEGDEGAHTAIIRELQEELGLIFTVDRFLGCMEDLGPKFVSSSPCSLSFTVSDEK